MRHLLWLLPLLMACNEEERARVVEVEVAWSPEAGTFAVRARLHDIDRLLVGCGPEVDVATCVANVRTALEVPAPGAEPTSLEYALGASLVQGGARDITLALERAGDVLDLVAYWVTPVDTAAASWTGVTVEREGRPGHERPHLTIQMRPGRMVDAQRITHRLVSGRTDLGPAESEVVVLPRRTTTVHVRTEAGAPIEPLLEALPGVEQALVDAGLLPPLP